MSADFISKGSEVESRYTDRHKGFPISGHEPSYILLNCDRPLRPRVQMFKAPFDYCVTLLFLVVTLPAFLMIALIIKSTSRGPVLFCQPRVGLNGMMFSCYKFRTMYEEATDLRADRQTEEGDPRVTATGRWLRRLSLDELPQLLNVLAGDMSLVGPRPHAPGTRAEGKLFAEVVPGYERRHVIKPGITGLAQVSGCRGPTDRVDQIVTRVAYDLTYIERMSLALDLKIVWATITREIFSAKAF